MSSQTSDGPGPAVPTCSADFTIDAEAEDISYFQTLPEHVFETLYPHGIRPPANLGPITPFDRYDQWHAALLHLAAGVKLEDVMRIGRFDIDSDQFVKHMAIFCARSSDYSDQDILRARAGILGQSCTHLQGSDFCLRCSGEEFITSMKTTDLEDEQQTETNRDDKMGVEENQTSHFKPSQLWVPDFTGISARISETVGDTLWRCMLLFLIFGLVFASLLPTLWMPESKAVDQAPLVGALEQVKISSLTRDRDGREIDILTLLQEYNGILETVLPEWYSGYLALLEGDVAYSWDIHCWQGCPASKKGHCGTEACATVNRAWESIFKIYYEESKNANHP